jgi:hypothetical protein
MPPHDHRHQPLQQQQQQQHRDYRADHSSGGGGGGGIRGAGGGGGGGRYYPQDEQQQSYHHGRMTDVIYHRPTIESSHPPSSNQSSVHHPPVPHRPTTHHPAGTNPSASSSQLQMLQMQHHPPYPPQMASANVANVVGGGGSGDGGNSANAANNPLLSTRQRNPSQKGCSCRKTRCLKLYCQCFAASVLCSANQCICDGCQNNEGEALKGNRGAIAIARRQVLVRNPNAFENKFLENNPAVDSGSGSIANAIAPDAPSNASMAVIYRPPPPRHNGGVDSGRMTGYAQVGGYSVLVGGNDVRRGGRPEYDVPAHQVQRQQQQQHLGRLLPPPLPRTGLPHYEFQFRSLDCPSTTSLRQEDAVVDETVEETKATMGCEDNEAREPSEGGLEVDDAGTVGVETSTGTETTKIDEEEQLDDEEREEKSSSSKEETSKSPLAARSRIVQEVDNVEMGDPQDDRLDKDSKVDSQKNVDSKIVVEIERKVEQEEREQPENDNIMGGSSSSISTSKSLEPSSTSSFSKLSFEMTNSWYRRGEENDLPHSRSWEIDRRQCGGGSYNSEYEGRHAVLDYYYNQHHPTMRGLGYNEDRHRGFDPLSHPGHAMGSGTLGGSVHHPSSGLVPYQTVARQYPGGRAPAHHVALSHQLPGARINVEGERGHTNMDVQQMQGSIPSKVHRVGCKCKKSKCLKKYCECFSNGIKCASHCKCENCGNQPTDHLPGNPQGSSIQTPIVVNATVSSDNSIELSPGRTLHIVSSEEDKASIAQRPASMPSLDTTLDDDQYSKEGSSKHQIKTDATTATAEILRRTSDNDMKLDFLATLATSALDTLNADAKDAANKRKMSREEDQLTMDGKEYERMDQSEASLKRHRSGSDGMDPRKRYISELQDQQRHHNEQKLPHQYQAPQAYHYDQYVHHHPQYEERRGHSAYHQQSSHHQQHQHYWPSVQHQLDSRSFAPCGQQGHSQGASHPQAIRPQFSRYQPPHHQNPTAKYTAATTSEAAVHVPDNISTALATAQMKNRLPKGLTYRKVCSHCGRQRAEHGEFGFGNKCPFTTCGRCGADQEQHRKDCGTCIMGVYCTLTEEEGAKRGASEKYDAVLADLAARAEVRACMTIALERC